MSALFSSLKLAGLELANRITVSPMCQYSAEDGTPTDWHLVHYGALANSGAGLVVVEASHVERVGRITHGCLGIYSDENEAGIARILACCRKIGSSKFGIQLAHAGRKASSNKPWIGVKSVLDPDQGWETVAASAIPFGSGWHTPREAGRADMDRIRDAFVSATLRALRIGFDELEVHAAHGYLLHSFLSPLANRRTDEYGGSFENRTRFPLEVLKAVRDHWPAAKPLGVRLSVVDWDDAGWTIADSVGFAKILRDCGFDFICASSGGAKAGIKVPVARDYQTRHAGRIRREAGIKVRAVGLITESEEAERLIAEGHADMVALARGFIDNPHWAWSAAHQLGASVSRPNQYLRASPDIWPGAARKQQAPA